MLIRECVSRKTFGRACLAVVGLAFLASCGGPASPVFTPSPYSPSPSPSSTATKTPAPSHTPTVSPTPQNFAGRIPIIEYHYTTYHYDDIMMTTEWFLSQMDWLSKNGYRTLSAEQLDSFLGGGNVPEKSLVLSFDAGTPQRADFSENIIPVLRKYHFHALFFVVTNFISDTCGEDNELCWPELNQWSEEGLISVESHGVWHPHYPELSASEQRWDAETARQIITEKTGRAPIGFAYPYDEYDDTAIHTIQSAGYRFALAGNVPDRDRAVHISDPDRYTLPRVYPYSNYSIYPVIYGTYGETFEQVIQKNSSPLFATPSPTLNATVGAISPTGTSGGSETYAASCAAIDQIGNSAERLYALDHLSIESDIRPETQAELAKPILFNPSCNIARGNVPRGIVLHITRGTLTATLSEFQRPQNTSAHYVIDRDGQVYQLVPENLGAFHASCAGNRNVCVKSCPLCEDVNGAFKEPYLQSVGIELVNAGQLSDPSTFTGLIYEDYLESFGYRYWEDFPDAQLQALKLVINDIRARWGIPLDLVVGHYRINDKTDPGPALNISWPRYGNPPRPPIFAD